MKKETVSSDSLKEKIEERKDSPDYGLMKEMLALLEDVAGKQDLQTVKNDEIEEELEYLTSVIKDMQQLFQSLSSRSSC